MSLVTIYDENVEWVFSSLSATYHPADMSNPHTGVIDLVYNNNVGGARNVGNFAAPSTILSDSMVQLSLWFNPSNWAAGRTVLLNWGDSGGNEVGNTVTIQNGTFGFNTASAVYQNIVIPMSSFGVPAGTQVGQLVISSSSGVFVYLLDTVVLTLLNVNCDPSTLASAAICFEQCIPDPAQVRTYLLCQFLTACRAPLAPTGLSLSAGASNPTPTTIAVTWSQPLQPGGPTVTSFLVKWGTSSGNYNVGSAMVSSSTFSYTITGLNPSTSYFIVVEALATSCPSANSNELSVTTLSSTNGLLNNLSFYFPMESLPGGNTTNDIIAGGTMTGLNAGADSSLVSGIITNAIQYTGAGSLNGMYQVGPNATFWIPDTGVSQTYQCWFWVDTGQPSTSTGIFSFWESAGASQYGYFYYSPGTGLVHFVWENSSSAQISLDSNATVTTGAWHHFVGGYDATNARLFMYIDGGAIQTIAMPTIKSYTNGFAVGTFNLRSVSIELKGRVCEFGGWHNRVLNATDVANLNNSGRGLPESSFTN